MLYQFELVLSQVVGKSEFLLACMSTPPTASEEASVMMEKGCVTLGILRTGVEEKICLSYSKAFCCNDIQFQGSSFWVSKLRGVTMLEKSGMNFL